MKAMTIAKSPAHFRFSILDFRLPEQESATRIQHILFILFSPNPKSKSGLADEKLFLTSDL
jgi:hypothetical protein